MDALRRPRLLWLLLGSLLPLLFLLDWLVERSGGREVRIDAELQVALEGQGALLLALPLEGAANQRGLEVEGAGVLKEARYPWRPTGFEGRLWLRLEPEFLGSEEAGPRSGGFAASYRVRELARADGYGIPPVPCRGSIDVRSLDFEPGRPGLEGLRSAELGVDLRCTAAGPDLVFGSGDETVWEIRGELRVLTPRVGS